MAFKISASAEKDLKRAINNFNAKVKRLENIEGDIYIPEKANITAIKNRVTNKWELNREIDKLERFTQRNAEELIKNKAGTVLSRWEYENLQREQKRLSARLLREIEQYGSIKPKEFGESQAASYAQMGDGKLMNLKAKREFLLNKSVSKANPLQLKQLIGKINTLNANYKTSKKQTFYDNYLDGTLINLGYYINYDTKKLDYIREKLSELSPDQFVKAYNEELSLKYIQERNTEVPQEEDTPIDDGDITPVLDELYKNIDKIVSNYKQ